MEYRMAIGYPDESEPGESVPDGFLQRELRRIAQALREPQSDDRYQQLYAAQQALAWALEPGGFASPIEVIERGLTLTPAPSRAAPRRGKE